MLAAFIVDDPAHAVSSMNVRSMTSSQNAADDASDRQLASLHPNALSKIQRPADRRAFAEGPFPRARRLRASSPGGTPRFASTARKEDAVSARLLVPSLQALPRNLCKQHACSAVPACRGPIIGPFECDARSFEFPDNRAFPRRRARADRYLPIGGNARESSGSRLSRTCLRGADVCEAL